MDIIGIKHLEKLKRKNKGNNLLINAIDVLIADLEINNWKTKTEILQNDKLYHLIIET